MFDFREWVILIGYVQNNRTYAETTHIVGDGRWSFAVRRQNRDLRKALRPYAPLPMVY
jgi:hypothetical protein